MRHDTHSAYGAGRVHRPLHARLVRLRQRDSAFRRREVEAESFHQGAFYSTWFGCDADRLRFLNRARRWPCWGDPRSHSLTSRVRFSGRSGRETALDGSVNRNARCVRRCWRAGCRTGSRGHVLHLAKPGGSATSGSEKGRFVTFNSELFQLVEKLME